MNERRLVEHALLISMLANFLEKGIVDRSHADAVEAAKCLHLAGVEVVSHVPSPSHAKFYRLMNGLGRRCITPYVKMNSKMIVFGLAVFDLLEHLIEEGYLSIVEGSYLAQSLDFILPALEPAAGIAGNTAEGNAIARGILASFQAEGLFPGVKPLSSMT